MSPAYEAGDVVAWDDRDTGAVSEGEIVEVVHECGVYDAKDRWRRPQTFYAVVGHSRGQRPMLYYLGGSALRLVRRATKP